MTKTQDHEAWQLAQWATEDQWEADTEADRILTWLFGPTTPTGNTE
jgi:hypothetical protein